MLKHLRILAGLKSSNVRNYRPTVSRWNLVCVTIHLAPAICDHIEEMSDRCIPQPVVVIGRRFWKTAANDHSITISRWAMADNAVNIEPLLSPVDQFLCDRDRKRVDIVRETGNESISGGIGRGLDLSIRIRIIDLSGIKGLVLF